MHDRGTDCSMEQAEGPRVAHGPDTAGIRPSRPSPAVSAPVGSPPSRRARAPPHHQQKTQTWPMARGPPCPVRVTSHHSGPGNMPAAGADDDENAGVWEWPMMARPAEPWRPPSGLPAGRPVRVQAGM
ncbi:hypothetical protein SEVIR_1G042301v4 [Setaria viridis]